MNAQTSDSRQRRQLTPEMASFRLLVLAFATDYIVEHNDSPSYGEIAAALDSNRTRVKRAIRSLVGDGKLLRVAEHRGLRLPSLRDEVLRQLRDEGWSVDEDLRAVTNPTLLPPPELDYPGRTSGEAGDEDGKQAA